MWTDSANFGTAVDIDGMKLISLGSLLAVFVSAGNAQQGRGSAVFISPVPGAAPGWTIPADSPQFVFLGPTVRQLTISYPSALAGIPSEGRITFTIKKLDQVKPIVSSTVSANADGTYDYRYALRNDSSAPDPISVWSIAMPAVDAPLSASHASWTSSQETATTDPNPLRGAVSMSPVALASWHAPKNSPVPPNATVSGFEIKSAYRPGFTLVYARSAEDYATPNTLPAEVNSQLTVMRQRDWMNKRVAAIGPRFPNDWTRDVIAADFKDGMARLIESGDLDPSSKFVMTLNSALDLVVNSQGAGISFEAVVATAGSTLEKNIANAISVSLK